MPNFRTFSLPRILLHVESFLILILIVAIYNHLGPRGWWFFALLLLVPDIAAVGYLVNTRIGAICYNAVHNYAGPVLLGLVGLATNGGTVLAIALVWAAHIALDRTVGYGLKYASSSDENHLKQT